MAAWLFLKHITLFMEIAFESPALGKADLIFNFVNMEKPHLMYLFLV